MAAGGTALRPTLHVGLLGPITVSVDGQEVALSRLQARKLVALLAARPTTWSADELVDQLWLHQPPVDPVRALRVVVSRLRSAVGAGGDCIESVGTGYRLVGATTDFAEFDHDLRAAQAATDPATAAQLLEGALALWRGSPFVDCLGPELFDRVAQQWDERRRTATAIYLETLVAVGRFDDVVASGIPELAEEADSERVALPMAHALAALGRRRDALDVLQSVRHALREAGLDSSGALAATEHDILTGAVELRLRATSQGSALATDHPVAVVGREDTLDALADEARTPGAVLVTGEPGSGKSTLFAALGPRLCADGRFVALIAASETPERPMHTVHTLLAELSATSPDLASSTPGRGRDATINDAAVRLARLAPASTHTLIVDDAHLLDDLSADVLASPNVRAGCSVVYGSWPAGMSERPLPPHDRHHSLGGLDWHHTDALVQARTGRSQPELSHQIHQLSGGNPLFASLLLDLVAEGEPLDQLPSTVHVAVQHRLSRLRQRSVTVLQAAAALGTEFGLRWLRLLAPHADAALNEAREAGLVSVNDLADEGRFVHGLVASSILQLTPPARLVDLHDRIGRHIHDAGGEPAQYATHFEHAADIDPQRAVHALLQAAATFADGTAWDLAADLAHRAFTLAERYSTPAPERHEVQLLVGTALRQLGRPESADHLFDVAVAALGLAEHDLAARAVTELCAHGATLRAGATHPQVKSLLLSTLELDLAPARRAELCATATAVMTLSEDHGLLRGLFRDAFEQAIRSHDPDLRRRVLAHAHIGLAHPDDFGARHHAATLLRAASEGDLEALWEASFLDATTAMVEHRTLDFSRALDELRSLTPRISGRPRRFGLAFTEAAWALYRGAFDEAEAACDAALHVGLELYPAEWVFGLYGSLLLALRDQQGRLSDMSAAVEGLLREAPDFGVWHLIAALGALHTGDSATASAHWQRVRADDFGGLPVDITWTASCAYAARVAVALGDLPSAELLCQRLAPYSGRMAWSGTCVYWPIDTVLAEVYAALGRDDDAASARAAAAALLSR